MKRKCINCETIEEVRRKVPSKYCRKCQIALARQRANAKKRKEHRCYRCGNKVKPKIIYPSRCETCKNK